MVGTPIRPAAGLIGQPLALTPEMLDHAAAVTNVDVVMARAYWHRLAPARYIDILDAIRHA